MILSTFQFVNDQTVMNTVFISILICLIASGVNPCFFSPQTSRGNRKICSDFSFITIIQNDDKDK